jgi:magnesium-protoporphyrin O-methyltransferase
MTTTYIKRRGELETYFDRTAAAAWARLTSDAPVGKVRATVRAGRDEMRATLLGFLPADLKGCRLLDAGCGTGALAVEAARRGAEVVAIDLSPTLVALARERMPGFLGGGSIRFESGDMLDPALGLFDHVIAMDSLIHYRLPDMVAMIEKLAARSRAGVHFTYAPKTPALTLMWGVGKLFPRGDRSPAIEPAARGALLTAIAGKPELSGWRPGRDAQIATGFYISHAQELVAA